MSESLISIFAKEQFESVNDEIVELRHKGKITKFVVISREWDDEKIGFDLILKAAIGKNWRFAAKEYTAFQSAQSAKTGIQFTK